MARWCLVIIGVLCSVWQAGCETDHKYDNHTLIRIFPQTLEQVESVSNMRDPDGEIEVLKSSRGVNDSTDILVPPNKMDTLKAFLRSSNVVAEIKQENYGKVLDPIDRSHQRRRVLRGFSVFQYQSYPAMQDYLRVAAQKHPDILTVQNIGQTYMGKIMKLAKISTDPQAGNPIIFIDAGIHAREWAAPAMAMYLIHRLTNDPNARVNELNGVDWYILPVANPDGYEFTRTSRVNRMWRKTRSKNGNCFGVDGNRNYGFKWAVSGVSHNPCDKETYAGPQPFSESETRAVRNIMMENAKRIKLYVSLHSYGQYLVYPWGYTGKVLPLGWKKLDSLARAVSSAVQNAGGKPFKVLSAGKWYAAAGGSDDFAFGAVGVPYSYTMELTDGYEFVFPENLLSTVLPQFYEGFKVFGTQIANEFGNTQSSRRSDRFDHILPTYMRKTDVERF